MHLSISLRIATRKSPLALWQANAVKQALIKAHPKLKISLVPISSSGDQILDRPLADFGGKGLFVKEVEQALLSGQADIAVHSAKDMPPTNADGLHIAGSLQREDPRDAWISSQPYHFDIPSLRVGTASPRRTALLRHHTPQLQVATIRGNIATRIKRYKSGEFHATLLAMAGLKRLEHPELIHAQPLDTNVFVPAAGQGIIAMQCRDDDTSPQVLIKTISDKATQQCLVIERALVHMIQGNCHSPIGAFASLDQHHVELQACVLDPEGKQKIQVKHRTSLQQQEQLAEIVFQKLCDQNALSLLQSQ